MIVDFHTHCFPDHIAKKAIPLLSKEGGIDAKLDGTAGGLVKSMELAGIDMSVIMPIATRPDQTRSINNWAGTHTGERLVSFGTIHPDYEDWEKEIERIHGMGLKGIKFHPEYQNFDVDDPSLFPIYKAASELGLVIYFHAGRDFAFDPPCHCPPDRLIRVLEAFPDAYIAAAHMGGYLMWEEVEKYLAGTCIYFDTSFTLGIVEMDLFYRIIEKHDTDRIMFASDSPWADQKQEVDSFMSLDLDEGIRKKILGLNAKRLLQSAGIITGG